MQHRSRVLVAIVTVAACGSPSLPSAQANPPAAATPASPPIQAGSPQVMPPTPAPETTSRDARSPILRLGHYSTRDGLVGLVLDRTSKIPKAKIDGTTGVLDLAVRRGSPPRLSLISARGELVLEIDDYGRIAKVGGESTVWLFRDAEAAPLPDPPVPALDDAAIRDLSARTRDRCHGTVRYEVIRNGDASPLVTRGLFHVLHRAARALDAVCRDALGQEAVARKVRAVRLTVATKPRVAFDRGLLEIDDPFDSEAFGPFEDELRALLEGAL